MMGARCCAAALLLAVLAAAVAGDVAGVLEVGTSFETSTGGSVDGFWVRTGASRTQQGQSTLIIHLSVWSVGGSASQTATHIKPHQRPLVLRCHSALHFVIAQCAGAEAHSHMHGTAQAAEH